MGGTISSGCSKFASKINSAWNWSHVNRLLETDKFLVPAAVDAETMSELSSIDEVDTKDMVYNLTKSNNKQASTAALFITCILIAKGASITTKLGVMFDQLDFNGKGSMTFDELVVLLISIGTALACILQVQTSYREQSIVDIAQEMFKVLDRKQANHEKINRAEFIDFVNSKLSLLEDPSLENCFKKFCSDGTYVKDVSRPATPEISVECKKPKHELNLMKIKKSAQIDILAALPYVEMKLKISRSEMEGCAIVPQDFNGGEYGNFIDAGIPSDSKLQIGDEIAVINETTVVGAELESISRAIRLQEGITNITIRRYKQHISIDQSGKAHDLAAAKEKIELERLRVEELRKQKEEEDAKKAREEQMHRKLQESQAAADLQKKIEEERLRLIREEEEEELRRLEKRKLERKRQEDELEEKMAMSFEAQKKQAFEDFDNITDMVKKEIEVAVEERERVQAENSSTCILYLKLVSCEGLEKDTWQEEGIYSPSVFFICNGVHSGSAKILDDTDQLFNEDHRLPWYKKSELLCVIGDSWLSDEPRVAQTEVALSDLVEGVTQFRDISFGPENKIHMKLEVTYESTHDFLQFFKVRERKHLLKQTQCTAEVKRAEEARRLIKHAKKPGILSIEIFNCKHLVNKDDDGKGGLSDPLVAISIGTLSMRSRRKRNTLDPEFNENFKLYWDGIAPMEIEVLDYDGPHSFQPLGSYTVDLYKFDFGTKYSKTLKVVDRKLQNVRTGTISFEITFLTEVERKSNDIYVAAKYAVTIQKAQVQFKLMDKDSSGFLEKTELTDLFEWTLQIHTPEHRKKYLTPDNMKNFLAKMDQDGDGRVSQQEFSLLFQELAESIEIMHSEQQAQECNRRCTEWSEFVVHYQEVVDKRISFLNTFLDPLYEEFADMNENVDTIDAVHIARSLNLINSLKRTFSEEQEKWEHEVCRHSQEYQNMTDFVKSVEDTEKMEHERYRVELVQQKQEIAKLSAKRNHAKPQSPQRSASRL